MKFSTNWKSSKKPKKQRKYRANAPLHLRKNLLRTHLSNDLSKKFGKRTCRIITGDKVKVMKGQFKGKTGKIDRVNTKNQKVYVTGIEHQKTDGTKIQIPISASNLMITELNLSLQR